MNDKEFKEFILNRIKKDKNCIQNKNCIGDLLNYPDLLYRAIEMDIVDIVGCKDNFNKEFKTRINLQGMEFESKHKKYTSVYAVCKENKQNCKKVKLQLTGPITAQYYLKWEDNGEAWNTPQLSTQVFNLCLLKSIAMIQALKEKTR